MIVGLGIFAVPEIVALLRQDRSISESGSLGAGYRDLGEEDRLRSSEEADADPDENRDRRDHHQ